MVVAPAHDVVWWEMIPIWRYKAVGRADEAAVGPGVEVPRESTIRFSVLVSQRRRRMFRRRGAALPIHRTLVGEIHNRPV